MCLYCHEDAERSPYAGVPATERCMGCHNQIWNDSSVTALVRTSADTGAPHTRRDRLRRRLDRARRARDLTLLASRAVTGGWGLVIAFVIAAAKAGLVVAFFMHLAGGRPIHRMVFAAAIAFTILLVLGILADVGTRSIASSYVDDLGGPP